MNEPRKVGPLRADHPLVEAGTRCLGCDVPFQAGDYVTLVAIGPGRDPEARHKARHGQPYSAIAIPAHWACVTGLPDQG